MACCLAVALGLLASEVSIDSSQGDASIFPSPFEGYLSTTVRPSASERKRLMNGRPITKLLDADESREVAVFGGVWIDAPLRRYVEAMEGIEKFERGSAFTLTKRISAPPRLDDFAQLRLSDEDVRDLRSCRIGDCQLKLGERGVRAFRTKVNWNSPGTQEAAERVMRRLAFEYVTGYLDGGNERLAVYRDH